MLAAPSTVRASLVGSCFAHQAVGAFRPPFIVGIIAVSAPAAAVLPGPGAASCCCCSLASGGWGPCGRMRLAAIPVRRMLRPPPAAVSDAPHRLCLAGYKMFAASACPYCYCQVNLSVCWVFEICCLCIAMDLFNGKLMHFSYGQLARFVLSVNRLLTVNDCRLIGNGFSAFAMLVGTVVVCCLGVMRAVWLVASVSLARRWGFGGF